MLANLEGLSLHARWHFSQCQKGPILSLSLSHTHTPNFHGQGWLWTGNMCVWNGQLLFRNMGVLFWAIWLMGSEWKSHIERLGLMGQSFSGYGNLIYEVILSWVWGLSAQLLSLFPWNLEYYAGRMITLSCPCVSVMWDSGCLDLRAFVTTCRISRLLMVFGWD